jgi:AcrR family transcriptional regulator
MKPIRASAIATTRKGRPVDAGKHDAILDHARRMFTGCGLSGANMDQLADAAGVSKATIYNHFDSKEALFETVLRDLLQQLPTPAELVGHAPGALPERLAAIAQGACELATSVLMHDIQRMLASLPIDGAGRSKGSFWRECLAPYQHAFSALLREEVAAGRLRIADIEVASSQFFSLAGSEPFIRMLMGDAPAAREENASSHVAAAVATFLRAHAA